MAEAEVEQQVEEQERGDVAELLRRHYHSTYPPETIVFTKSGELEEELAKMEISYRDLGSLIAVEMGELAEKLPELAEWLQREKREAEQRLAKLNTSTRNKGGSTGSSGESGGRVFSGGGVAHNTTMPLSSHYNIVERMISSERLRALARKRGNPNRVHTSVKIDRDVWVEFKSFLAKRNLTISEVLEDLILIYLDAALAYDADGGIK